MNDERIIIASIKRNYDLDSRISKNIIKELIKCSLTDEPAFINTIKLMTASGGHIQVNFLVPICTLDEYYDFFIDDEGLIDAIVYAHKKHECLEESNMFYESNKFLIEKEIEELAKTIAKAGNDDAFKKICESFACIGKTNVEASDINNDEKDFEYVCDRCGVRVKTPNTLRGPVNVVDFYREVEDAVGDSVSYRLCRDCMQDFFDFLSYN